MSMKKSKKPPKPPIRHLLFGIPTNIAVGPLGFRAELDTNTDYEKDPMPSRLVLCERESEVHESPTPGTSSPVVAADNAEHLGNRFTREMTGHARQEEGEPPEPSIEKDRRNTALNATVALTSGVIEAPNGFGSLKALLQSLSDVDTNHEESTAIKNKIKVVLLLITSLDILFLEPPEPKRTNSVCLDPAPASVRANPPSSKLGGIEEVQRSSCENLGLAGQVQGKEDGFRLLEDIHEAVFQYQMARQTMINSQRFKSMGPAEAAVLSNVRSAQQAEYRHGDRNGCLKGTRGAILDEIELWTYDFQKPPVYWLNGLAGTGKSTIAQTITERIFAGGRLGASFFCSRDFEDRSNLKSIFPTLAVQLARNYSKFRSILVPLVQLDPEIVHESLYNQMNNLIVQPLVESGISTVIVIDALDECKDEEPTSALLSVLGQFVAEIPKVKFFVTGRPEPRIREGFRLPLLAQATDVFVLHEVEPSRVNSNIRLFFGHKFSEIKGRRRGSDNWPTEEQLDQLCERSGGLFVHAMATVRFVDQRNADPKEQLDSLLRLTDNSFEGKTKFKANATLDSLYTTILQEAFGDDDPTRDPRVRAVLGAVILATNPLSPTTIATLLSLDTGGVFPLLSSLHSLLILRENVNHPVRPFHKSFSDFIIDPARCINPRFRVHPPDQHAELLVGCLEVMNRRLEQNMCNLPAGVANSEVIDLKERAERHIDQALRYACQSWHKHLVHTTPTHSSDIVPVLRRFLEEKFLFWLEVLSILDTAREAVDALKVAERWLGISASPALAPSLVEDCFRFLVTFFEVVTISAPHIYHTALLLSPQRSTVRQLYEQYAHPLARVVHGLPSSWEPIVATFPRQCSSVAAWSPCNKFIAIDGFGSTKIDIVDAVTLKQLIAFNSPKCHEIGNRWLSFSPDSHLLTQFSDGEFTSWDLQTGGPVGTIPTADPFPCCGISSTYSMDGKMVAVAYSRRLSNLPAVIITYNLLSRSHMYSYAVPRGRVIPPIWTHGECIRFAAVEPGSISIWEAGFSSIKIPTEVKCLPLPDEIHPSDDLLFLPTLSRIASRAQKKVLIWDAQDSKMLLDFKSWHQPLETTFSSDGRFFTFATGRELHVWRESPIGYALHQHLVFRSKDRSPTIFMDEFAKPLFSSNGEFIIAIQDSSISLWPTRSLILNPYSTLDQSVSRDDFLPAFSLDETLAAIIQPEEKTVTVLDLESGDPRLVIDAGMRISCLRVTGSTLAVASGREVVAWDIRARDSTLRTKVYANDSVHTTTLRTPFSMQLSTTTYTSLSPDLSYVAVVNGGGGLPSDNLQIYDTWTGEHLTSATADPARFPHFTPGGREVWCAGLFESVAGWSITEESEHRPTELEPLEPNACPPGVFPWKSSRGYQVTDNGWVLSPTQKRLVWLPHHWWPREREIVWQGRFLGFLHGDLPELVILELLG